VEVPPAGSKTRHTLQRNVGDPAPNEASFKRLRLRYQGKCVLCGAEIAKGVEALYDPATKTVRCVACSPAPADSSAVASGTAGESAHREYERRHTAREASVKARLGNVLGGVALAIAGEPQSTRAWERGSLGERKLGDALAGIAGIGILHDRRVPGTRGNIDHIVVAASGVFVIDAKHYAGLIRIRDRGSFFRRDDRLYVGSRDCSALAENMTWQLKAVRNVLDSIPDAGSIPVQAVLCFVEREWPLFRPPESYNGVRLEGIRSIKKLLAEPGPLDSYGMARIARRLSIAFPCK